MNPKISIIVPVYNAERYLNRCVDSILAQTFTDFEVLLIDDGSTDKSGVICDEYAGKDERVKVFHKENGGVSSARNVGLENANGEWISFVDADDCLNGDALETYMGMASDGVEMIMAGYRILGEDGDEKYCCGTIENKIIDRRQGIIEMYNHSDFPYQGYVWCKMLKTSIIRQYNILFNTDICFNEDRLFLVEYISRVEKRIAYTTKAVYNYFERSTGAMATLKNGYNKNFVTDFDACLMMKDVVKILPEASELITLADKSIMISYDWNHQMMYRYNDYCAKNHWHMVRGMVKAGVFVTYLKQLVIPIVMFVFPRYFCGRK